MPDSTAVADFKMHVFRALDAAAREYASLKQTLDDLRLDQARDSVKINAAVADGERIRKLEAAMIDPERMRSLEAKVTRLDARSAIIGAITGAAAGILIPLAVKYFAR